MMNIRHPIRRDAYPIIETERLILRMFKVEDLDVAYQLFNDADVQKYLSVANLRTREQMKVTLEIFVRRWRERGFGIWCVTDKRSGDAIGYCGFQYFEGSEELELLFAFLKNYWRRGLATEVARTCLKFWFEQLDSMKVAGVFSPENVGSQKVLEKNGFRFAGNSVCREIKTVVYSIYRHEYQADNSFYKLSWDYYN